MRTIPYPHMRSAEVCIPDEILEAKRLWEGGRITKAEVDRRIAGVNAEIRALALPQEKRKTKKQTGKPDWPELASDTDLERMRAKARARGRAALIDSEDAE